MLYVVLRNLRPKIIYENEVILVFILISHSFLYIIRFHCCHQVALDLSFNLMYYDLEYDG